MIRDFLNTEDDMDYAEEAAVRIRIPEKNKCDLSLVDGLPLGMMYAPMQVFRKLYDPQQALCRGTLFCELDLPFRGGKEE